MNTLTRSILSTGLLASALFLSHVAQAATQDFSWIFQSNDSVVVASGTLDAYSNGDGTYTATSGTISFPEAGDGVDGTAGTLYPNPSPPGEVGAPGFLYDDQLLPGQNPLITNGGLLFQTDQFVNIYSNFAPSPPVPNGTYTLYEGNGFNINGNFTLIPEPAYFQLGGFIALGGVGMLRMRRRRAQG